MNSYDWIVVGNGLAGAALSYELSKFFSVLLVERPQSESATRYSYGGIPHWSGTTELTRQLCSEGMALHRQLSDELDADTEFRDIDLLMPIPAGGDPEAIAAAYANCATPPLKISAEQAGELEPLLNPDAIVAALTVPHGHVNPAAIVAAYNQAFMRQGGQMQFAQENSLVRSGDRVVGVQTPIGKHTAANVAICAGGESRALLKAVGISVPCYFTQAEMIMTPPVDLELRTLVMAADIQRFQMESIAGQADELWDQPGHELAPTVLDAGAIQFQDGSLRLGQISRTRTDTQSPAPAGESAAQIRSAVATLLPALKDVPGEWHHCLVAFSSDRLPLVGAVPGLEGAYLFSGFSSPFVLLPPIARRFATFMTGAPDPVVEQLSPDRFSA